MQNKLIIIVLFFVSILSPSVCVSLDEFLSLTYEQKLELDEFRDRVSPQLPHDYMKKDVYLIRWLRDSKFDIHVAEKRLMNHIEWRAKNDIDSVRGEDWSAMDYEYRAFIEGCDHDGKPILSIFVGDWDVRRAVIGGNLNRLKRYIDKVLEEISQAIREMQESGQNVTQGTIIYDMDNFNLVTHACARCIPIYLYLLSQYEIHYPGLAHKIIAVNVPQVAFPIWDLLKHVVNPSTREVLYIYGKDKKQWQAMLRKDIDQNQLSQRLGGSNEEGLDIADFRAANQVYRCSNLL